MLPRVRVPTNNVHFTASGESVPVRFPCSSFLAHALPFQIALPVRAQEPCGLRISFSPHITKTAYNTGTGKFHI